MGKKVNLSVVILVGKEVDPPLLKSCLKSLSFTGEIIEVDTTKIKGSFSDWRNEGMRRAQNEWVLQVDPDEEITQKLKDEIINIVLDPESASCYAIPRRNFIFGKEFKYGGQYPDYQKRLFKKSKFKKWVGDLHEEPIFEGELGHLKNALIHHKNISISEMMDKTNKWSEIEAKLLYDSGHPKMNWMRFLSAAVREFYLRFIKQLSFLDGKEGTIYGIYQIYSRLITYSKLWELQLKDNNTKNF